MSPLFDIPELKEHYYHKDCPIQKQDKESQFSYHEYSSELSPSEQLAKVFTTEHHTLVFQLEGTFHINWEEHKDVTISKGEMYFIPRGAKITCYTTDCIKYITVVIERGMTTKEIEDLKRMREYKKFERYRFKPLKMNSQMMRFAESIKEYLIDGVNCMHLHKAKSLELQVILHWHYSIADNAQLFYPMTGQISNFTDFILKNFHITTSIGTLIKQANMSRSTFDRKFKETFDTTPHKWIEEHTRQLIVSKASEPNVTVKDMMYEVGIYNSSQFTNFCKRLCGATPSALIRSK